MNFSDKSVLRWRSNCSKLLQNQNLSLGGDVTCCSRLWDDGGVLVVQEPNYYRGSLGARRVQQLHIDVCVQVWSYGLREHYNIGTEEIVKEHYNIGTEEE